VSLDERVAGGIKGWWWLGGELSPRSPGAGGGHDRAMTAQRVDAELGCLDGRGLQSTFSIAMCSIPASTNTRPRGW
jgi:hypothetical protein